MKDEFDFATDLDSILAEFSSQSPASDESRAAPERSERYTEEQPERREAPELPPRTRQTAPPARRRAEYNDRAAANTAPRPRRSPPPERTPRPAEKRVPEYPAPEKTGGSRKAVTGLVSLLFAVLSVFALMFIAMNIHPGSGTATAASSGTETKLDMSDKLDVYMNNSASDALGELTYVPKIYKLGENDTVAPVPDSAKYGRVEISNAAAVLDVIQKARDSGLLEGQEVMFNPNAEFYWDSDIRYYYDDTILVICWKELIDGNTCSCVEVKIADASQFKRKIADDTFGSSSQYYASTMSKQVNAVVAMNADFYQFRNFGIVAYQRQLYRFSDTNYTSNYSMYNCIDNCFVTAEGNFLFMHKGDTTTAADVEQFMADNNVLFTIAFGPILVEDGVVQTCSWYPAGEPTTGYSRAGIGQFDKLHYFYMSLNHSPEKSARWTVDQFAQQMFDKGINNAYGLDGGQTSEIVFQHEPYNYIDFGSERLVSDIIYFATAIPNEEAEP